MIRITTAGSTAKTEAFLERIVRGDQFANLEQYGRRGVEALRAATPRDSGATADAWEYEIVRKSGQTTIFWSNTNVVSGFHIVVGLQYGHATGQGGWVQGYDFINPALKPIFDEIADAVWKEVQKP